MSKDINWKWFVSEQYVDVHVHVWYLLTARSEEHDVLQTGSIHVAILSSCQFLCNSAF